MSELASSGLPDAFKDIKRVIVVCAHADDTETMMGGTAWLLAQQGVVLQELICTCGDLGTHDPKYTRESLAKARREEARSGGEVLGFSEVVTLDYHDGELEPSLELRATIAHYYRLWQSDALFTFDPSWAGQIHGDHRAAGRAALDALMPSRMELYHPEQLTDGVEVGKTSKVFLFNPTAADLYVDVTDVHAKKLEASVAHVSQFPGGEENLQWMRYLDTETAKQAGAEEGKLYEQFSQLSLW
ncbi:MAG: PIG-L deacetylase family protein [Chloroflexia bacterium]